MKPMKTPGVYVLEKDAFPNSVVPVATAVPVFIGHTEKAMNGNKPLSNVPWRITSLAEFHQYFGGAPTPIFELEEVTDPSDTGDEIQDTDNDPMPNARFGISTGSSQKLLNLKQKNTSYALYAGIRLFFQNGGSTCYIMSIGAYEKDGGDDEIDADKMIAAMEVLVKEPEPTLVVIPEATRLSRQDCIKVQQAMLMHCGDRMKNRFAVLDVFAGHLDQQDPKGNPIAAFRDKIGVNNLDYGAAYYPWVKTSIFQSRDFSYLNLNEDARKLIETLVTTAEESMIPDAAKKPKGAETEQQVEARLAVAYPQRSEIAKITSQDVSSLDADTTDKTLRAIVPIYQDIMGEIADFMNCMPPAAGIVGVYSMVDADRGVWKAPANVSLNSVVSAAVNISHEEQEDLNVTPQGKSINALRPFVGEGILVWGARTLDGNSLDWRFVNVRRTMIFLEESIKLAAKAYVFEPNTANTWVTISSMIENFLTGIWKQGGLPGAVPEDAFSVHVGLGQTMTPTDILEGIMRITVLVAISRPAEFIEITFQQQMQKS